jgi:hypothetical protein
MKLTMTTARRVAASAIALSALAAAAVLTTTAPASAAAGAGQLEVCSSDNYASFVKFPARGDMTTVIVNKHECRTFDNLGSSTKVETIKVYGIDNAGKDFWVQNGKFRPSKGGNVVTYGTAEGKHWALTPQF